MKTLYDPLCGDLARAFLGANAAEENVQELAGVIQVAIEDWERMRLICYFCGKSVSNEVPEGTVVRAALVCPECIEKGRITLPDEKETPDDAERKH